MYLIIFQHIIHLTMLTDNDGADFPSVDPRMRTRFDGTVAWASVLKAENLIMGEMFVRHRLCGTPQFITKEGCCTGNIMQDLI